MNYGERLKSARKAKNYTQQGLADVSGVPQDTISKIERGDQDTSTYDTVLANALAISPLWLSTGKGEMKPSSIDAINENPACYNVEPSAQNAAELGYLLSVMLDKLSNKDKQIVYSSLYGRRIAEQIIEARHKQQKVPIHRDMPKKQSPNQKKTA